MKSNLAAGKEAVHTVRAFNRFYTRKLGLLNEGLLDSDFSLTEVRILFEIAHHPGITATALVRDLGLDRGYMSRTLDRLARRVLIRREASDRDARQQWLTLSPKGGKIFNELNAASSRQVADWLAHLPTTDQQHLARLLQNVEALMHPEKSIGDLVLGAPRPGDYGWVVSCHGSLYASEYGWNEQFEGLVAKIVANYLEKHDPAGEHCWIARVHEKPSGCVFLVRKNRSTAQLRLLLVEPGARGHGVGRQLVAACIAFARKAGYRKIQLWTNSVLDAARHIYEKAGFVLVESEKHHSFGQDLVGQTWELMLKNKVGAGS